MSPYWRRKQYGDGMGDTTIIWMDFTTYKNWMQSFVVLLAHESVEQRTFCWRAVALHEENVLLSMLLQPCKNTKNAFNSYNNIFTFIWNTVKIIIICINILHL